MNSFLDALRSQTNLTTTENGAVTNKSSLDPCVDFFALAGAMRDRPQAAADLFEAAYAAEPQTAVRILFYLRDIRGGQGERAVFKACMQRLMAIDPVISARVTSHIPEYGRWDDVFHSGVSFGAVRLIQKQLSLDLKAFIAGHQISLMAKWLPSANATSVDTKHLAATLRQELDMTPREYRKTLSALRGHIRLLEQDMSTNNWDNIEYDKIPSQAHARHTKAFKRHTAERYQDYLDSVAKGEKKINVKTVYPHEIWQMVQRGEQDYANVAWDHLPDYTRGKNALVMPDVSDSMTWQNNARAMAVAVSLALYFAERNEGPLKGHFMTFSSEATLVKVRGTTLAQKMANIRSTRPLGGNTDLSQAFRTILAAAKQAPDQMPEVLYIISDMEFDQAVPIHRQTGHYEIRQQLVRSPFGTTYYRPVNMWVNDPPQQSDSVFETAKAEFAAAGLTLPHVVFWNVEARQNQAPALAHNGHVSLVSGLSPSIFSQAVENKTPRELMEHVVNGERYEQIVL